MMPGILVFATNNAHKLEEVRQMLTPGFTIRSLGDIGCTDDIPETGTTFEENAAQKSQYVFRNSGLDCFADDSGLEVLALANAPGVYSARYSGTRDPTRNLDLVLENMRGISDRRACFRTVISLVRNGREQAFEGVVRGTLREVRSGEGGFGYDSIFQPDGYDVTFAEMTAAEKNRISHRGAAVRKMAAYLTSAADLSG